MLFQLESTGKEPNSKTLHKKYLMIIYILELPHDRMVSGDKLVEMIEQGRNEMKGRKHFQIHYELEHILTMVQLFLVFLSKCKWFIRPK